MSDRPFVLAAPVAPVAVTGIGPALPRQAGAPDGERLPAGTLAAPVSAAAAAVAAAADATTRPFRHVPVQPVAGDVASRAEGFAAGYAAGAREAARVAGAEAELARARAAEREALRDEAVRAALVVLQRAAAAAQGAAAPVLAAAEDGILGAAAELARAVLGRELDDAEHAARAALARVLDHPQRPAEVLVRLHPRDLAALEAVGAVPSGGGVTVVADPSLRPGDAVGQHPDGLLDARVEQGLARALAALRGEDLA